MNYVKNRLELDVRRLVNCMRPSAEFSLHKKVRFFGFFWLFFGFFGFFWLFLVFFGFLWLSLAFFGFLRVF